MIEKIIKDNEENLIKDIIFYIAEEKEKNLKKSSINIITILEKPEIVNIINKKIKEKNLTEFFTNINNKIVDKLNKIYQSRTIIPSIMGAKTKLIFEVYYDLVDIYKKEIENNFLNDANIFKTFYISVFYYNLNGYMKIMKTENKQKNNELFLNYFEKSESINIRNLRQENLLKIDFFECLDIFDERIKSIFNDDNNEKLNAIYKFVQIMDVYNVEELKKLVKIDFSYNSNFLTNMYIQVLKEEIKDSIRYRAEPDYVNLSVRNLINEFKYKKEELINKNNNFYKILDILNISQKEKKEIEKLYCKNNNEDIYNFINNYTKTIDNKKINNDILYNSIKSFINKALIGTFSINDIKNDFLKIKLEKGFIKEQLENKELIISKNKIKI